MDYKHTLNLPQTSFSMRAEAARREPEIQSFWKENDVYQKNLSQRSGDAFILHDGPPYLSSDKIHMGHAMNRILKDIVVKYKTLNNHPSPLVFGYDCHGLPIEHEVTKNQARDATPSALEIRQKCQAFALSNLAGQQNNFFRLGLMGNWESPYLTLSPEYEAAQLRVFAEMVDKGYIYKGLKPVYWSIGARTALAEAEVEYQDIESHSIYVKMPLLASSAHKLPAQLQSKDISFVIWTTTPWTLPANLGVCLNPDIEYCFVETETHEVWVLAEKLMESVLTTTGHQSLQVLHRCTGKELEYLECQHPFYTRHSLVILGQHVTTESGTGCVHTAPGHGMEDYLVGEKYKLGILSPVNESGHYTEEAPLFEGMFYLKANPMIIEMLSQSGHLVHHSLFTHAYPHCWRTKTPLIYRATKQWFASVDGFREAALNAVQKVQWIPSSGQDRIGNMIRDRSDWCISRQRVWGVPIPAFYCVESGDAILRKDLILHLADRIETEGSDIWWRESAEELLPPGFRYEKSSSQKFAKETDIMDVWFDSGTSHSGVLRHRPELSYPADLYLEGSDQHRGWFQSSLLTGIAAYGQAPYKTVLTHGFALDGEGRKMSKSVGNVVEPQKVIDQYGADVLRLWVASVDYASDVKVSYDILKQLADVYRKIRNTVRFLISNLYDFDPEQHRLNYDQLSSLDQYTLHKLQQVLKQVNESFENYAFYRFYQLVQNFCVIDLSNIYFAIVKDILYIEAPNAPLRRSVQTVLWEVLQTLLGLITPVLSHMAEDAYQNLPENLRRHLPESALLATFPVADPQWEQPALAETWEQIMLIRDTLNQALENARTQKVIGRSMEASISLYHHNPAIQSELEAQKELYRQVFIVAELSVSKEKPTQGILATAGEQVVAAVQVAEGQKCQRCWIIHPSVGESAEHPGLCERCATIVSELA